MSGTVTPSNQSKTRRNKRGFFVFLSAALVACMLFLGTGLPVFADESTEAPEPYPLDANLWPFSLNSSPFEKYGHLTPYQLIDDYGEIYNLDQTNNIYELSLAPASGYVTVLFKGLLTVQCLWTNLTSLGNESVFLGSSNVNLRFTIDNLSVTNTVERLSVENIDVTSNYEYYHATDLYYSNTNTFGIRDIGTMFSEYITSNPLIRYQVLVFASYKVPCTKDNFNQVLDALMSSTVSFSVTSQNQSLSAWAGSYNSLEMLNYIQTQLYEIYRYDQGIFSELASVLTKLQNIDNRFVSLLANLAQYHLEDQNWQNRLYTLLDGYLNPSEAPSVATELESKQAEFESAESEAYAAIESAIPDAESEWESLESYNVASEITLNHNGAITFWKTVTEYILNSNQIGAAATGLLLASLICFIVFLLRL